MKNHVFVQARQNSQRFPNKILKKICEKPIAELIIERIRKIQNVDDIFLITGPKEQNDEVIREFKRNGVEYFSGSEENILDRFYQASKVLGTRNIIRITGDNPLLDFNIINNGLKKFSDSQYDILSNNRKKTFPIGLNFEIFTSDALKRSWEIISKTFDDQDIFLNTFISPTKLMLEDKRFQNFDLFYSEDLSNIRLTLDYEEDFKLISKVFELLYTQKKFFLLPEILNLLKDNPGLLDINKKHNENNLNKN